MVVTERLSIRTKGECDIIDITADVERIVSQSGVDCGTVTVFISGSTAGVTTIEYEPGAVGDFREMWERLVPRDISYRHDQRWGDGNGYSHVRASTLGPSLTVPFSNRALLLGTWQQIIIVDFDNRPRSREIILQILGE